jgi:hypothetical protein
VLERKFEVMPNNVPSAPKVGASRGTSAGNRGKGRKKGVPNKTTALLKDAILNAFDRVGGEDYLMRVAKTDYKTFCTLLGRVLPQQHTGANEGPIHVVSETAGSAREKLFAELERMRLRKIEATPIEPPASDIATFKINKEVGA